MSDPVTITTLIIAAIPSTIASILSAIIVFRSSKITRNTNDIVNGSMTIQLKLHAKTARTFANYLVNDAEAIAIADLAERMLKEHENKVRRIDGTMER